MSKKRIDRVATGENIKNLMEQKNISIKELAEILGVSFQSVSKYISGKSFPNLDHLISLAVALDVRLQELIIPLSNN